MKMSQSSIKYNKQRRFIQSKWYLDVVKIIYDKYSKLDRREPNHKRFFT